MQQMYINQQAINDAYLCLISEDTAGLNLLPFSAFLTIIDICYVTRQN